MAAAATMAAAARELVLRAGASDMEEEEGPLGAGPGLQEPLQLGELDITSDEFILDEVDVHIQANLEDELVKEALKTGVDLRHYSKQVELELQQIEQKSIRDYIQESENIASLHNQITACDAVLEVSVGPVTPCQLWARPWPLLLFFASLPSAEDRWGHFQDGLQHLLCC